MPENIGLFKALTQPNKPPNIFSLMNSPGRPPKIISAYSNRWVIEEFFRNAKQLTDMEGATIRSEQGVTLALCLVSWIDSLLHLENYKQSTAGKLPKGAINASFDSRLAQYENLEAFMDRVQKEDGLLKKWCDVEQKGLVRKRKKSKDLIKLQDFSEDCCKKQLAKAA